MNECDRLVREQVWKLVPYQPGKPIEEVKRELGLEDIIKLASNENVLGPSPKAVEAIRRAAEEVWLYPDGSCFELRRALSSHLDVPPEMLVFGNGSDEIIHYLGVTFLREGETVIQAHPSFVRYEAAAVLNNAECIKVPLSDLTHDLRAMREQIDDRTKMVFIANPNNPTGTINTRDDVEAFLDDLPDHVITVFDEAYFEYVDSAEYPDTVSYARQGRLVIVLRTFSKVYALAGLRIGYGIAPPEIVRALEQVREPFNVSLVAQRAAIASLADADQVARARAMNAAGKEYLYAEFDALGLTYAPTQANFVFVDTGWDSRKVFESLLHQGVIVRTGDIFGLPTYIRVTIGTEEQNRRFVEALKKTLQALQK